MCTREAMYVCTEMLILVVGIYYTLTLVVHTSIIYIYACAYAYYVPTRFSSPLMYSMLLAREKTSSFFLLSVSQLCFCRNGIENIR